MMFSRYLRSAILIATLALFVFAGTIQTQVSARNTDDAVDDAIDWIIDQQRSDGGFAGFDGESDPGTTADIVLALSAAGVDPTERPGVDASPLDYLESTATAYSETQAGTAKLVLAFHAAGEDSRDIDGEDLVALMQSRYDESTGAYSDQVYVHATVMLAIFAAGDELQSESVEFLLDRQIDDGSWAFTGETEPGTGDTNTTSLAVQALIAAGESGDVIESAIDYILNSQLNDGSIIYAAGLDDPPAGDSNSTALAIQAMLAAGLAAGDEPVEAARAALMAFQNDSGAFMYREDMPEDNVLSTAQAIPALMLQTYPIPSTPAESSDISSDQAGLVIYFDEDAIEYHLIDLPEDEINALELLAIPEPELELQPFGGLGEAVCSIDGHGCPSSDCFCESYSSPSYFWQFYAYDDGQWAPHHQGAAQHTVQAGEILGWIWTAGDPDLPELTFSEFAERASQTDGTSAIENGDDDSVQWLPFLGLLGLLAGVIAWTGLRRYRRGTSS